MELPELRIGRYSVNWYQQELDRYHELANQFIANIAPYESDETEESVQKRNDEYTRLLVGFSKPFLQS